MCSSDQSQGCLQSQSSMKEPRPLLANTLLEVPFVKTSDHDADTSGFFPLQDVIYSRCLLVFSPTGPGNLGLARLFAVIGCLEIICVSAHLEERLKTVQQLWGWEHLRAELCNWGSAHVGP
jgi:hypothetical protein